MREQTMGNVLLVLDKVTIGQEVTLNYAQVSYLLAYIERLEDAVDEAENDRDGLGDQLEELEGEKYDLLDEIKELRHEVQQVALALGNEERRVERILQEYEDHLGRDRQIIADLELMVRELRKVRAE